uniref:Uncharacterized protein LOC111103840 isoform X3 n=1 Tax=Crassostrea virginica TaxID=6565 RepID=A0A8B8APX2_CRAVI|nr:uncharacterized protein LOC111103840 isoform X3 [Crassostrea virginica]
MKETVLVVLVFIAVVRSAAVSILTDEVSQNSTYPNENEISAKNVDVFRQLLNQETIIRMNLVKNVHILMKDMLTLKEKLADSEEKISGITTATVQEISDLKKQIELLKVENAALKNETNADKTEIMLLKEKLVNVSNTLTDIKVEVRYLSITVFGMNDDFTKIDEKFQELENSTKEIETELRVNVKRNAASLSELETRHLTLIDGLKNTTSSLQADIGDYETNQLKISATISSLELFRINQTLSKCDPKQKVAFTAGVTSYSSAWNSGTLIFNSVILNVGNGYNPSTGVFTSPVTGTYVFYVTAVEYSKQYLMVDIVLNSVSKVKLLGDSEAAYQTGTNMVVLNLQKGDSVWVRHVSGKGYWSDSVPATTFTGFLIG